MTDAQARALIINDIDSNLFVEAGAGSGKTTMLVERMVAMVEKGLPVEKICTITFTKAAANEFYERFQKRLIERSKIPSSFKGSDHELPKPTEESAKRCQEALAGIDLCFMGTIDAFCNMILSEHPNEADIPSDARLISEEEEKEIYSQFYISVRAGKYGSELKEKANHFGMLFWNPEETFVRLIKEIMDRRNATFVYKKQSDASPFLFLKEDRETMIRILDIFNQDLSKLSNSLGKSDTRDPLEAYIDASAVLHKGWHYNYTGVQRALKDISKLSYAATPKELGFTTERFVREQNGSTVLNIADEDSKDALLVKLREYKYYKSLSFLLSCVPYLEEEMRQSGKFSFFDYLYYLRNMLQKDAQENDGRLIDYIYQRHSYFMIDEFQDTNPMQAEVFFHLAAENSNEPDWKKCRPRPGSLFIVGDPKQSIYRFRNADVSSYIQVRELFRQDTGKVVHLVNNFRSRNIVKHYFNSVFEDVMPEDTNDQSAYQDIENIDAAEDPGEFEGIYVYETYGAKLLADYPEMNDYDQLIRIIRMLVDNPSYRIVERDKSRPEYGTLRTIAYKDFMIIFASKKPIAACISRFHEEDIPIRVEGKVLFEECEALRAIADIYKTVVSGDAISLVAVLYGPLFGFNENDLTRYKSEGHDIRLEPGKKYAEEGIDGAIGKLSKTASEIVSLTPSALFEKIIDDYRIYESVPSDGMETVYFTLELIRAEERGGSIVTYENAVEYLEELLSGESGLERCLSLKEDEDAVHIANLHKVKGLEAPVVILAKAGTPRNSPEIRIEYPEEENASQTHGYIISFNETVDSGISYPIISTAQHQQQEEDEKNSLSKENDRLVYVAATRARNALIINRSRQANAKTGNLQDSATKWKALRDKLLPKGGDGSDRMILDIIKENPHYRRSEHGQADPAVLYDQTETTPIVREETYHLISPSTLKSVSKISEEPLEKEGVRETADETYSTLIGTMVHRMMEMILMSKDSLSREDVVRNVLSEYLTDEFEGYRESFAKRMEEVYEVMHHGGYPQINGADQDILPVLLNVDEVCSEVPFSYREEDNIINGIIDLIYRKDGKLHIIDWKTNRNAEGLAEHYKGQLDAYKKAVKQMSGEEAEDALIYHISIV
jgi:ATP-dependent exoDNAse (exonuclease V) beta subunit